MCLILKLREDNKVFTNIIKKQITIDYIEECFFQRKAEWEYLKEYDIIFDNILVNAINMIRLKILKDHFRKIFKIILQINFIKILMELVKDTQIKIRK